MHLAVCAERSGQVAATINLDPQASAFEWSSRRVADSPEVIHAASEQLAILLIQEKANGVDFAIIDTAPHSDKAATVVPQV